MLVAHQGTMAQQGWRRQIVKGPVSEAARRGSGYRPGRGAFRYPSHSYRTGREKSWWDRDFDDLQPKNPWKTVESVGGHVTAGSSADWPAVGSGEAARSGDAVVQTDNQRSPTAVETNERKPGLLHLPLHVLETESVGDGKPRLYSQVLRTESTTVAAKDADDEAEEERDGYGTIEAKKKKKKKREGVDTVEKPQTVKKSKQRMTLDLSSMFEELEKVDSQGFSSRKLAIGGGITAAGLYGEQKVVSSASHVDAVPRNVLDSTAPVKRRGKEREQPKQRKPSSLKRIILKEREEKRINRDMSTARSMETEEVQSTRVRRLHSRRFRDYCDQVLDKQLDDIVMKFLQKLTEFQDKQFHKDPSKAKQKRRIVLGLREVHKHLKLQKLKCVIVSPNVESITSQGGTDDLLHQIRAKCEEQKVPIVFALSRRGLGRAVSKKVPVSIVGVFSYDGAQAHFNELLTTVEDARHAYTKLVAEFENETKRLEEIARSGRSSSGSESSGLSSRKTSKTDSESDGMKSERKISGTSDDGDWMFGGNASSQLSAEAPEFHPLPYQAMPPSWTSYSPYEYPTIPNQMMSIAPFQYYIPHHGFVASPPRVRYEQFQSHQVQGAYVAWRDTNRDQRQGRGQSTRKQNVGVMNERRLEHEKEASVKDDNCEDESHDLDKSDVNETIEGESHDEDGSDIEVGTAEDEARESEADEVELEDIEETEEVETVIGPECSAHEDEGHETIDEEQAVDTQDTEVTVDVENVRTVDDDDDDDDELGVDDDK
ncbi:selenocysteine insertion sequence-binding protein 2-like isoform X2 [Corticium candelabrum]|nr:selenocysteine insertion sequence-binding protein 2-like isoform X2 [Corticium candelabrum]